MKSNIKEVIYLNWMLPIEIAQKYVPKDVELINIDGFTPFTILSYRHGNFGPKSLGKIRMLSPSPLQSNWRFYVKSIARKEVSSPTIYFYKNYIDNYLYIVGSYLFSDVFRAQKLKSFSLTREAENRDLYLSELLIVQLQISEETYTDQEKKHCEFLINQDVAIAKHGSGASYSMCAVRLINQQTAIKMEVGLPVRIFRCTY